MYIQSSLIWNYKCYIGEPHMNINRPPGKHAFRCQSVKQESINVSSSLEGQWKQGQIYVVWLYEPHTREWQSQWFSGTLPSTCTEQQQDKGLRIFTEPSEDTWCKLICQNSWHKRSTLNNHSVRVNLSYLRMSLSMTCNFISYNTAILRCIFTIKTDPI